MTHADSQIFVVDDDDAVRDSLCVMLGTTYPNVSGFASGHEFLTDYRRRTRNCLIIDIHMPGMTGLDVIGRLADLGIKVPAILMTGRADSALRARAIESRAYTLLDKPVDFFELTSAIDKALESAWLH
jgi:two-component system, LuxR family, response regulator FixJ